MGIQHDYKEFISKTKEHPVRSAVVFILSASAIAVGVWADEQWGPRHQNETPPPSAINPIPQTGKQSEQP